MQREGYAQRKNLSPTALTATIAIHAAGLAAILLIRGDYVHILKDPPIKTIDLQPLPSPPPENPVDQPKTRAKVERPIDQPKPVEPTSTDGRDITIRPVDPFPPSGGSGTGPVIEPTPIDPPPPVLVDASPDPRFAGAFQPPYPPAMQRMGREGKVVVRVLVGSDGRVKSANIVASDDEAFSSVTLRQALGRWRFRPATRDGAPVEGWKTLTVRFEMKA